MYEAVHVAPDGDSAIEDAAVTAATWGFDGIVIRNHGDATATYHGESIQAVADIDIVDGIELRADDPSRLTGYLGNHRAQTTIIVVHGGREAVNRFAVNQPRVDVLAHPTHGDAAVDEVLVRTAASNNVRLEFNFARVLRATGGSRVRAIAQLRKLRELVDDADAPFVVTADPFSHLHLRAPRELMAVGEVLEFSREEIETGLVEWHRIATTNRERLADDYVEPGVRRGEYSE